MRFSRDSIVGAILGPLMLAPLAASAAEPVPYAQAAPRAESVPYEATGRYDRVEIEGWRVLVHPGFTQKQPQLRAETLKLLQQQLYQIVRVVPPAATAKLRKVTIWVEANEPHHPCMCYHLDAGWPKAHGMNPDKERSVEIANPTTFLKWTIAQPWMVLHELAHAYHHQFLAGGYDNPEIKAAYERAVGSGRYDLVRYFNGQRRRAYALTNPQEFFAEQSEAFFGTNDFYPFVRAELQEHDPRTLAMLEKLWGTSSTAPR
jgi:hypothetical protein